MLKLNQTNNSLYDGSYIYKINYDSYSEYTKKTTSNELAYFVYPLDKARGFIIIQPKRLDIKPPAKQVRIIKSGAHQKT